MMDRILHSEFSILVRKIYGEVDRSKDLDRMRDRLNRVIGNEQVRRRDELHRVEARRS